MQHGVSLEAIHGHIRLTSPPHTSRFASNPWRSCGQRKPAIPDSRIAETAVYGFKPGFSTSRTYENPLQWCSTAFNSAVRHRQLTQQSSTGPACAELRCRATRQTAMVSCLAVRMSKWSNLLLFKHGVCSKRDCWYVYYKKKRRWRDGQLMPVVLVPTI